MSSQLQDKAMTLAQMLAANRLTKVAGDQEIEHLKVDKDRTGLGGEMQREIEDNVGGTLASTPAAANEPSGEAKPIPQCQDLNETATEALRATGTKVETMDEEGKPTAQPSEQYKTASAYRDKLAQILSGLNKKAALQKQAAEAQENFRTGTEVQKLASLNEKSSKEDLEDAADALDKLAAYNPVFQEYRNNVIMRKMAEDIAELAEETGVSPEEAAAALDAAAENDPAVAADLEDEATGEAVGDLANAEAEAADMMGGVQQLADNASSVLGQEVTPDDIMSAIDQTAQLADELGVPPEALIQAAVEEMTSGEGGEGEVTEEDLANADAILEEAANNGISPEEVIQMASEELGAPAEGGEAAPAEEAPEEDEGMDKEEACKKGAGCGKGKNCKKASYSPRVAYAAQFLKK